MAKKVKKKSTTQKKSLKEQAYQIARGKLKSTPFDKAEDLKKASNGLRQKVWERLETARIFSEMSDRPEYDFINKEFKEGLKCKYGNSPEHLVKVYSEGPGIEIDINQELVGKISQSGTFVESLIRSVSDTFSKSYYKSKGILPNELSLDEVVSVIRKTQKN